MKQQRHQASVTAFFDMLRLRKLPTCIKVDGTLGCKRPYVETGNPSLDPWLLTSNGCESYCFASEVSTYLLEIPNNSPRDHVIQIKRQNRPRHQKMQTDGRPSKNRSALRILL